MELPPFTVGYNEAKASGSDNQVPVLTNRRLVQTAKVLKFVAGHLDGHPTTTTECPIWVQDWAKKWSGFQGIESVTVSQFEVHFKFAGATLPTWRIALLNEAVGTELYTAIWNNVVAHEPHIAGMRTEM